MRLPTLIELLEAGVHFGHQTSKRHPKMEPFIFGQKAGISIINLEKTLKNLEGALEFIKELARQGKKILFLSTKKQARAIIENYAKRVGMPFVNFRWLGGTLTNFSEIHHLVKKFRRLKEEKERGEWEKYTKKERLSFEKEIKELEEKVGGIENLDDLPEAIFIIDIKKERTALREAKKKGIKIVAICDTNVNPLGIDYIIPGNDDALKSIELFTSLVAQAVEEGQKEAKKIEEKEIK